MVAKHSSTIHIISYTAAVVGSVGIAVHCRFVAIHCNFVFAVTFDTQNKTCNHYCQIAKCSHCSEINETQSRQTVCHYISSKTRDLYKAVLVSVHVPN